MNNLTNETVLKVRVLALIVSYSRRLLNLPDTEQLNDLLITFTAKTENTNNSDITPLLYKTIASLSKTASLSYSSGHISPSPTVGSPNSTLSGAQQPNNSIITSRLGRTRSSSAPPPPSSIQQDNLSGHYFPTRHDSVPSTTSNQQPAPTSDQGPPEALNQGPETAAASNQQPAPTSDQGPLDQEPGTSNQEPGASNQEPGTSNQERPRTQQDSPGNSSGSSIARHSLNVASNSTSHKRTYEEVEAGNEPQNRAKRATSRPPSYEETDVDHDYNVLNMCSPHVEKVRM